MKFVFASAFLLIQFFSFSQKSKYDYPAIPEFSEAISKFVPLNWKIKDIDSYDSEAHSSTGIIMVIESRIPVIVMDTTCYSSDSLYHPKMLLIVSKPQNALYKLVESATKLFEFCNSGVQDQDPYQRLRIKADTITLAYLTGGTLRDESSYSFAYLNNDWYTIKASRVVYQQGQFQVGAYYVNIDLLKGFRESYETDENEKQINYSRTTFQNKPLIKLRDFDFELPVSLYDKE